MYTFLKYLLLIVIVSGCGSDNKLHNLDQFFLLENNLTNCSSVNFSQKNAKLNNLLHQFCELNEHSLELNIVKVIDLLKKYSDHKIVGKLITSRLKENDSIYHNRGAKEVIRLRGYLMASLGEVQIPEAAISFLITELKHSDRKSPYLIAASARAAGNSKFHQQLLAPYLIQFLDPRHIDDVIDLDNYNAWPPINPTSIKEEVLKSIIRLEDKSIETLSELVRAYNSSSNKNSVYFRNQKLLELTKIALTKIDPKRKFCSSDAGGSINFPQVTFLEKWTTPSERNRLDIFDTQFMNVNRETFSLKKFTGKPFLISYFYTRCGNQNKCSMTVSKLGHLKDFFEEKGMADQLNILGISLDPQYDTPQKMLSFADSRGIELFPNLDFLKSQNMNDHLDLMKELDIAVSYQEDQVNIHGIELLVFDKNGHYVRRFGNTHWDFETVLHDIKRLVLE